METIKNLFSKPLQFIPSCTMDDRDREESQIRLIFYVTIAMYFLRGPKYLIFGALWMLYYSNKRENLYIYPTVQPEELDSKSGPSSILPKTNDEGFSGSKVQAERILSQPSDKGRSAIIPTLSDKIYSSRPAIEFEKSPNYMDGMVGYLKHYKTDR